jgi:hypothetical protein
MAGNTYFFSFGSTVWVVPPGVTSIQVECFGSTPGPTYGGTVVIDPPTTAYHGGSYSKSNTIAVTAGNKVYYNLGFNGGDTWFNTTNTAPTSSSSTSSACLAVGGNYHPSGQVAANCGNVKYAGGAGVYTTGYATATATAQGGQAGPNGPGADAGVPYTNTTISALGYGPYLFLQGGGANGGSQGSLGVPGYGRSGSGTAGMGGYTNGISIYNQSNTYSGTQDVLGTYQFNAISTVNAGTGAGTNYGIASGGNATRFFITDCGCGYNYYKNFQLDQIYGFVVITVLDNIKSIVYNNYTNIESSFVLPSDFGSLVSMEAIGGGGSGDSGGSGPYSNGGGGGGAYAKTLGSSVTASMVAGSTVVYYGVSVFGAGTYINIGTSGAPTSVTTGVLAKEGSRAGSVSSGVGGLGGATATSIGDTKYAGGNGGNGNLTTTNRPTGGGGGAAGPSGAGANGSSAFGTATGGAGGGGAANGGSAAGASTSTAGGTGGAITGGSGGTAASSSQIAGTGYLGGGGGGGFSNTKGGGIGGGFYNGVINAYGGDGGNGGYTSWGGNGGSGSQSSGVGGPGRGIIAFTYTVSNNKTAALTGSASSVSGGTLSSSQTLNQTLSGRSATASTGTLTNSQALTQALSGSFALASAGILGTSTDQIVGLNSASAAAYGGTLTNSQIAVRALTGVSASGQTSSFPIFLELVGAQAAASTGTLNYINTGWQLINTGGTVLWTDIDTQQT